jgi:hypothetical protein
LAAAAATDFNGGGDVAHLAVEDVPLTESSLAYTLLAVRWHCTRCHLPSSITLGP